MTLRTIVVCLLLFYAMTAAAQNTPLNEAVQLIRAGHYDQAQIKLREAEQLSPHNAAIENLLGITETKLGQIENANAHYRSAIQIDPSQARPHRNLGFNLLNAKDYSRAETELKEALRLAPTDHFAHYYLFLLALATGHDTKAINQASEADELITSDPDAASSLIEAEIRTGHAEQALTRLGQIEDAHPIAPQAEYHMGVLFTQHTAYSQAVHCFRYIAAADPSWQNRYNLALALLDADQPSEASSLLAVLRREQPANADILMFLGSSLEMQQKTSEALEAYRAAIVADPDNPDRMLEYTRLLMDSDRYDEAIQAIQAGTGAAQAPLELRLAVLEMAKGDISAARVQFQYVLTTHPEIDIAYVGLAQTYSREANEAEALRVLESARQKLPGHYLIEYYFGLLASRVGRKQEAVDALKAAANLAPQSPDPFFELGKIYAQDENWKDARVELERVIALNPQFIPAHFQLTSVYTHLGLIEVARQESQRTHDLIDAQRDEVLEKQRQRAKSLQQ
jgi:tetratricopeptide (TPR) repeat protein